jgi:hypothetical protein
MACRQIKEEKNKIKNTTRLKIVSCSPARFGRRMPVCAGAFRIFIGRNRGLLYSFLFASVGDPISGR